MRISNGIADLTGVDGSQDISVRPRIRPGRTWLRAKVLLVTALLWVTATHATDSGDDTLKPESCQFVATYTQSREIKAIPAPLTSTGNMLYDCNQGLIWQTLEPAPGSIVYTTAGEHFRIDADNSVQGLNDLINLKMAALLLAMMDGDFSGLAAQFNLARKPGQVTLTPREDTTARFLRQIDVLSGDNGTTITLVDGNAQHTVINMDAARPLEGLDPEGCSEALGGAESACRALFSPGQVAAGLTPDR